MFTTLDLLVELMSFSFTDHFVCVCVRNEDVEQFFLLIL